MNQFVYSAEHIYAHKPNSFNEVGTQINIILYRLRLILSSLNIYIESYTGNNFYNINSIDLSFVNYQVYIIKEYLHL